MKSSFIKIYKTGKFCSVFGDAGLIVHELLGYKFLEYKHSVGFPESSLDKVTRVLENKNLPYQIYDKDTLLETHKGNDKAFNKLLKIALSNYDIEQRVSRLRQKIDECDEEELEKILEGIESGTLS